MDNRGGFEKSIKDFTQNEKLKTEKKIKQKKK